MNDSREMDGGGHGREKKKKEEKKKASGWKRRREGRKNKNSYYKKSKLPKRDMKKNRIKNIPLQTIYRKMFKQKI